MFNHSPYALDHLADDELKAALKDHVVRDQRQLAVVLAHLAEVERRKLYLEDACSSMFVYCMRELHFPEDVACRRITSARVAQRYPEVFDMVARGELHLTAITLLAKHLTDHNHGELLHAAVHRSRREVEQLIARRFPRPDVNDSVRRLPVTGRTAGAASPVAQTTASASTRPSSPPSRQPPDAREATVGVTATAPASETTTSLQPALSLTADALTTAARGVADERPARVVPLAEDRYKVTFTASGALRDKLREAQDLLRHRNPGGDLAPVVEMALDALLRDLRRKRFAETDAPRTPRCDDDAPRARTRHIPADVRRVVAERDALQCAFVSESGQRCGERAFLQFHHEDPYARGGQHDPARVKLYCKAHNDHAAEQDFGKEYMARRRQEAQRLARVRRTGDGGGAARRGKSADRTGDTDPPPLPGQLSLGPLVDPASPPGDKAAGP